MGALGLLFVANFLGLKHDLEMLYLLCGRFSVAWVVVIEG